MFITLLLLCGVGALIARAVMKPAGGEGVIPGFGSERVRAEPSQRTERSSILRGPIDEEEDDTLHPRLATAFRDVEQLEKSLQEKK